MADSYCPSCGGEMLTSGYNHLPGCLAAMSTVSGGWWCYRCNTYHTGACPLPMSGYTMTVDHAYEYIMILERIAKALEKIAEKME